MALLVGLNGFQLNFHLLFWILKAYLNFIYWFKASETPGAAQLNVWRITDMEVVYWKLNIIVNVNFPNEILYVGVSTKWELACFHLSSKFKKWYLLQFYNNGALSWYYNHCMKTMNVWRNTCAGLCVCLWVWMWASMRLCACVCIFKKMLTNSAQYYKKTNL